MSNRQAYQKAYYARNKDYFREYARTRRRVTKAQTRSYNLKKSYGITSTQYALLWEKQRGRCAICRQKERDCATGNGQHLVVDHDHKTLRVRGLLCSHCNLALGHLDDDTARLRSAISYLTETNEHDRQ